MGTYLPLLHFLSSNFSMSLHLLPPFPDSSRMIIYFDANENRDHWDCEGPAVTSSAVAGGAANGTTSAALSATPSQTFVPSSGVVVKGSSVVTFAGVFALAVAFAL